MGTSGRRAEALEGSLFDESLESADMEVLFVAEDALVGVLEVDVPPEEVVG